MAPSHIYVVYADEGEAIAAYTDQARLVADLAARTAEVPTLYVQTLVANTSASLVLQTLADFISDPLGERFQR